MCVQAAPSPPTQAQNSLAGRDHVSPRLTQPSCWGASAHPPPEAPPAPEQPTPRLPGSQPLPQPHTGCHCQPGTSATSAGPSVWERRPVPRGPNPILMTGFPPWSKTPGKAKSGGKRTKTEGSPSSKAAHPSVSVPQQPLPRAALRSQPRTPGPGCHLGPWVWVPGACSHL